MFCIGVFENRNCEVVPFPMAERVCIFYEEEAGWARGRCIEFSMKWETLEGVRAGMEALIESMGTCRVVLGREISGVPYAMLDQHGFAVWEAGEASDNLLSEIARDLRTFAKEGEGPCPTSPSPVDDAGRYFFDLQALLRQSPEISSKMALRRFLAEGKFLELDLLCDHVPPWLESFLPSHNLRITSSQRPDGLWLCTISRAACGEGPAFA